MSKVRKRSERPWVLLTPIVFANSLMASIFTLAHAFQLRKREAAFADTATVKPDGSMCFSWGGDLLVVGIIANYVAVAADTFSSELGILSKSMPRLITSPTLRKVPRGTNGGVTLVGLGAGAFGSMIIVAATMVFLPCCSEETAPNLGGGLPWTVEQRRLFMGFMVVWGVLGSLLDSILGGLFQRSVRDVRSGKIVEGEGGDRVLITTPADAKAAEEKDAAAAKKDQPSAGDKQPSRVVESGWDIFDNNDVNFIMAAVMSMGAMSLASLYWGVNMNTIFLQ